ncbi:MAG: phage portal protein, partial [Chloroflexi bacterium]|nr:phage portal protein [Chloroflexota bacterium]
METLSIVDQHLMANVVADDLVRLQRYREAWEAYHGTFPEPLKVRPGQPNDNVIANYARVVVDKGVSFLFGEELRFELDETAYTAEERWLEACWAANGGVTTLQKLALNGAVCGHTFVKLVPARPGQEYP